MTVSILAYHRVETSPQEQATQLQKEALGGAALDEGKVAYSNIQDNQLYHPLTCRPL